MIKLGTMVNFNEEIKDLAALKTAFENVKKYGLPTCQLCCWDMTKFTDENAAGVNAIVKETGVEITAFWCGWEGGCTWNFIDGYHTIGLVPIAYRARRVQNLKDGSDFAKKIGVKNVVTHVGFLPENQKTDEYTAVVEAIKEVALYCKGNGQNFLFETGQETPVTLRRTIERVGTGNLGINLDPANLLLYGKGNPCDALDVFGEFVMGVHAKDGEYPTDGDRLGEEKRIGEGKVNFPLLIKKLKNLGYDGAITIEREISGEKQIKDILYAKKFLEELIK